MWEAKGRTALAAAQGLALLAVGAESGELRSSVRPGTGRWGVSAQAWHPWLRAAAGGDGVLESGRWGERMDRGV